MHYKWRSYDVWFLRYWARHDTIFSHFGSFFAFIPPNNPKSKFWKMEKDTGRYHHFTQVYQISWSCAILFLGYGTWRMQFLFFILGYFLPFYLLTVEKIKIKKKIWTNVWKYHHFTHLYQKLRSDDVRFLRCGAWQTDGQTAKSDI